MPYNPLFQSICFTEHIYTPPFLLEYVAVVLAAQTLSEANCEKKIHSQSKTLENYTRFEYDSRYNFV